MLRAAMLVSCGLLSVASAAAQDARTDMKQMQGTWLGSLIRSDGKEPTEEEKLLRIKLVITGENYRAYAEEMVLMEGTLRLDPARQPRHIDAVFADGPLKGAVQQGIYELKGDGLTVTFARPGDPRDFQTRAGSDETTVRYMREKK